MTIRLLLIDDHAVVRSGLRMILEGESDMHIAAEAETAAEGIAAAAKHQPDVILMDIGLPDMSGIEATQKIKQATPACAIVALTIHEDQEYFFKMLEAGASGYVPKRAAPEELLNAIRTAAAGGVYLFPSLAKLLVKDFLTMADERGDEMLDGLTEREQEVLRWIADGLPNTEIANRLSISPKTVSRHRENIMSKLNIHSRSELVRYAIRKGIIKA
ncbi:MAG: response regulator transcription factor [Anaerolineae bacterium]|nr:MAG: response regulator transcription factor [Anaerolineae bacterium]